LRFAEDESAGLGELLISETVEVVALEDAEAVEREVEVFVEIREERAGFGIKFGLLFDEDAVHLERVKKEDVRIKNQELLEEILLRACLKNMKRVPFVYLWRLKMRLLRKLLYRP